MYRAVHGSAACEAVFHGSVPGPPQAPGVLFLSGQTRTLAVRIALVITKTSIHELLPPHQEPVTRQARTAGRRVYHAIKTRTAGAAGDARRKDRNMSFRGRIGFPGRAGCPGRIGFPGRIGCPARIGYPARIGCPARIGFPGRIGIRSYFAFLFLLKLMRQPASTISRSFSVMGLQYRLISVALPSLMT